MDHSITVSQISSSYLGLAVSRAQGMVRKLVAYASLLKLRVATMLVFTAAVGYVLGAEGQVEWARMALLTLGCGLAASGVMALNQYLERDLDMLMTRTAGRPLLSGDIQNLPWVVFFSVILILSGVALSLVISLSVAFTVAMGAAIYLLVYTLWLKRRHPLNIVIGGAAGCCPVLAGWLTGTSELNPGAWLLAGVVFVWTPPHFWSLVLASREDYLRAGIPMLPCLVPERMAAGHILVGTVLTIAVSFTITTVGGMRGFGLLAVVAAAAAFLISSLLLLFRPGKATAWRHYKLTSLFLAILFGALLFDGTS